MTPAEQWYRMLVDDLRGVYEDAVEISIEEGTGDASTEAWLAFQKSTEELMKWADLVQASKLRWRGRRDRVIVPELSLSSLLDANDWMQHHANVTWEGIREQAEIVSTIEKRFVQERRKTLKNEPEAIPLYRLEMLYRNTIGEVINTSEQVELSMPEIGEAFPYSEYKTRDDYRVRPTHAVMNGFVALRRGEGLDVLKIVRPKNGYNCRCFMVHRAWFEAVRNGWATAIGKPRWEVYWPNSASKYNYETGKFPDPGWNNEKFVADAA